MNTNTPNNPHSDAEFDKSGWIAQARELLAQSTDGLDAATLSRLNRGRQVALAMRARRTPRVWLLPGLAGACAMLLAVAIFVPHRSGTTTTEFGRTSGVSGDTVPTEGADALGSDDSVEFYQDLDFYAWLDAQGKDGAG